MAELRGAGDGPDDGDASARRFAADVGDGAGEARPLHEPSPRAEYADVVRHNVAESNAPADASSENASPEGAPPEGVGSGARDQPDTDQDRRSPSAG